MIPTGWQIQQERELACLPQADLATAAGVGLAVIVRAELAAHMPMLTRRDSAAIQQALETAGVEFIREHGGPGVWLRMVETKDYNG